MAVVVVGRDFATEHCTYCISTEIASVASLASLGLAAMTNLTLNILVDK